MHPSTRPISIVIVDDHEVARSGLRAMLRLVRDIAIVGEARNGEEAVELSARLRPDIVLMDVRMPRMDGLTATREIKRIAPATHVVIMTTYEAPEYVLEARRVGASGFLLKDIARHELVDALRRVARGQNLLTPRVTGELVHRLIDETDTSSDEGLQRLTARELEVLRLVARGQSNREIAGRLGVTPGTIKTHVERILAKLNVPDRTSAAIRALESGLIRPPDEQD